MPSPVGARSTVTIPPVIIEGDADPGPVGAPSNPVVSIPPVHIEGDAQAVQRLVKGYDATNTPRSCVAEGVAAAYGALEVAGAVGGTVLSAALGPVAVGVGLAAVGGLSFTEGQKLRALHDCVSE